MSVQPNLFTNTSDSPEQPIPCLLLASKEQYVPCHLRVSDSPERLSAILHGDQYYSLFRSIPEADKALEMVVKLGRSSHQTVITRSPQGYLIWVHEPDAVLAVQSGRPSKVMSTFSAAHCLVLTRSTGQKPCYLKVPDSAERLLGIRVSIQQQQRFNSLLRQDANLANLLERVAELTRWGEEIAIVPTRTGHAICVLEPAVVPAEQR